MPAASSAPLATLPAFVPPQLPRLAHRVPVAVDRWLYEVKFDGYRVVTAADGAAVRCYTRSGLDWTRRFGAVPAAIGALGLKGALLDGEICVLDAQGRSNFPALQNAGPRGDRGAGLVYAVFDLLAERGRDLRALPTVERKERLRRILEAAPKGAPLLYVSHVMRDGEAMLATLCAIGCEGIVAKRVDRPYSSGSSADWLKVKCPSYRRVALVPPA